MKKLFILATLILFLSCDQKTTSSTSNINTGTKEITLEEIWGGAFRTEGMNALNSMKGDYYTLLNRDNEGNSVVNKYSYKTLEKVETVVSGKKLARLSGFQSYAFNDDESKLILGMNLQRVYRRSVKGTYYAYDVASKRTSIIGKGIQEPTFSPDNSKIAYAKDNNLYILNLKNNRITQLTKEGKLNKIIIVTTERGYE